METSTDQFDTTNQCRAEYSFFDGAMDCAGSASNASICMCGNERCDSLNNSNTGSNTGSNTSGAYCAGIAEVSQGVKRELNLNNVNCVKFSENLAGNTLQVWDSDNASCDFRGVVESRDGADNLTISANYHSADSFTGRVIRFTPSNSCKFVQVRSY